MNLLLSLFILFFSSAEDASVHFKDNPEIDPNGVVLLRDVAALEFLAEQDQQSLGNIKIADSYDQLKKMSSRDILKKIKPQLHAYETQCECKLKVTIPHAMIFHSLPGNFAIEKVRDTIERELARDCPACQYDISPLNIVRGSVPVEYEHWNVDIRRNEWRGPTMVRVYFDSDAFSPLILQTLIKVKKPVLKLKDNVSLGHEVTANDYEAVMADVTYENARYAQASDLPGMEAKRTIGKGSLVILDDLIARNVIRAGQAVAVEMKNDAFVIEMSGVAQKNGRLGDKIPVRINKTQKNVSAEIVSDARVRM